MREATPLAGNVLVAGAGIGGLACALSMGLSGVTATVLEQAGDFSEPGAGIQLGPNAMRVLSHWGLDVPLRAIAAYPDDLFVRDSVDGRELGHLRLGAAALARFGQPYACVHRADLHRVLREAVQQRTPATLRLQARVEAFQIQSTAVRVEVEEGAALSALALIGCDGLWSRVREGLLQTEPARPTGHLAYRGLIPADSLPPLSRSNCVQVWLGANMHVVSYPVSSGEWINVVAVVHGNNRDQMPGRTHAHMHAHMHGQIGASPRGWTREARVEDLLGAMGPIAANLRALIDAVPHWTLWTLHDRAPLRGPYELARGPVALLGDAAHPLRPYLAQGAAMAIEDAWTLGQLIARHPGRLDWTALFAQYASHRWKRNARVQRVSRLNGRLYHARGLLRLGRNAGMKLLGERVLANAWLYGGPPELPGQP